MGSKNANQNKKKQASKNKASYLPHSAQDSSNHEGSNKIITDSRFASAHSDPRFQKVPKHKAKVAIDSRFDRMFSDKSFASSSAPLDKRGKPKKKKAENPLRNYYLIEENKEEKEKDIDGEEVEEESALGKLGRESLGTESTSESEASESEDEVETDNNSESTTDSDEDEHEVEDESIPVIEKETCRLAVVNMDWRHIKAVDLYVALSSFLPKDGQILAVSVYPSEFGLQRMKEEEVCGPAGLFDDENEQNDGEIDIEKLRAYEKSRLRYYYAVVECDSSATADYLFKACDGAELERSSNVLDLRFIPDSMEFKHPPRDVATEVPANYESLNFHSQALQHSNINLTWDEDEPERVKTLKRKFNDDQLAELELKEFLASDESEADDDENNSATEDHSGKKHKKRDMYRALIQSGDGSDGDGDEDGQDMVVTFNTGLEDISKRILEKKDKKSETIWEAYLRKKREKKKARKNKSKNSSEEEASDTDQEAMEEPDDFFVEEPSVKRSKKEVQSKIGKEGKQCQNSDKEAEASRAELELLLADDNGEDNGLKGFNLKPRKAKGKKGKEAPVEDKIPAADYDDPRFSALFTSTLFALDPTDPQFKRSAAYARQVAQKQKGDRQEYVERKHMTSTAKPQLLSDEPERNKAEHIKSDALPSNKDRHELSSLIRSVKMKSKQIQLAAEAKMSKKDEKLHSGSIRGKEKNELSTLVQSMKTTKVRHKS